MNNVDLIARHIQESIAVKQRVLESCLAATDQAGTILTESLQRGGKVLICGNGGSAADAQHLATELIIRYRSGHERRSLPALSLAADSSALTACANDYGFDRVFARQVEGHGAPGDVLWGITTSGNSENILQAFIEAKQRGMKTILFTGSTGGRIMKEAADTVDAAICIPSDDTARIQECHIMIGQILCAVIEKELFQLIS